MTRSYISNLSNFFTYKSVPIDITIFSFVLLLIPITLITGPAIPDICLSLIALYFLIKSISRKYWSYYNNTIVYGFLLFSIYVIIRALLSEFPINSLINEGSVFYFRYIFFAMGVWYLLDHNPYLSKNLFIIIFACVSIVIIDGIYQYFVGFNFLGFQKHSPTRLTGLFNEEPIIGRYISFLSLFIFGLILENFKFSRLIFILSISFLLISGIAIFLTGERAPLFYLIIFVFLIFIFLKKYRFYQFLGLVLSILIVSLTLQFNPSAKTRVIDLSMKQISETKFPFFPYSEHHEQHYISALKMFNDNPIFGLGTNTFRNHCLKSKYIYKDKSCNSHPHNFFIQILAELGILGFFFICYFFGYLSYFLIRQLLFQIKLRKDRLIPFKNFSFFLILFVYWWPLIPHMSLYNNWNNTLMMLPLGFLMKYLYTSK